MTSSYKSDTLMAEYEVDIEPVVGRKQITIPLPRKESTWANVNPNAPCLEEETPELNKEKKLITDEKSAPEIEENSEIKTELEKPRKRTRNFEEPKRKYTRRTSLTTKKPELEEMETGEEEEEESDDSEPTFDLDKIIEHREVKKRRKTVIEYLVRWLGYDESADTWEPEENILGDFAKEQIRLYWEKKDAEKAAAEALEISSAATIPIEQEKVPKKRGRKSAEEKARLKQQEIIAEEQKEKSHPVLSDFSSSGGSLIGKTDDETNHTWFGIKEEDAKSKHAKREFKNLYVSDRKLSLSEKLLAEVGTSSTGRVTRSTLKPLKEDVEPDLSRHSKTPEPTSKRRRQTESPAQVNRYSPEPPMAKRTRKSMPIPAPKMMTEKTKEVQKTTTPPASVKEFQKRASDSAEPPSKLMPKIPKAPPPPAHSTSPIPLKSQSTQPPKLARALSPPAKTAPPPPLPPKQEIPPILELIIDPRAKKSEAEKVEKTSETRSEVQTVEVPVEENKEEKDSNYLTNQDFEYLKDMEIPSFNVEKFMENVWDSSAETGKVVKTYDEFVRAVIEGDGKTVFSTFKAKCSFNLNERDADGRTLLHHIAVKECDEKHSYELIAKLLILQGAEMTITDSKFGKTALHAAVCANHICMVQTLIDLSSPINTVDNKKHTPLLSAIISNNVKMVGILLRAGVNIHNIHMIMEKGQVIQEIKDLVVKHKESIIEAMDAARHFVLPQAENVKGTVDSSLFVAPIAESGIVEYSFDVPLTDSFKKPGTYFIFEFALLKFRAVDGKVQCRMWQQSPVRKITINDKEPTNLHKTTNFISVPQLKPKRNVVKIEFMNQTYQHTKFVLASRICHVSVSSFNRQKRTEPNLKNLIPMGANTSTVSPAMKILSSSLKPRFYRLQNPPLSSQTAAIRKQLPKNSNLNSVEKQDSNSIQKMNPTNSTLEIRPGPIGNHHASSGSSTSSSPLPGFVPLRKVINPYPAGGLISRPMVTPLTAANNRLAVKQTQSTPSTTTTPTSETFPPSN